MSKLTLSPAWTALAAHRKKIAAASLTELFAADPSRAERFSIEAGELMLDYSKHRVDAETMRLLVALAVQERLPRWIARMFGGDPINSTEARAVLHVALRSRDASFPEGRDVMYDVRGARERMRGFVDDVQRGDLKGADGRAITDTVNIGIVKPNATIDDLAKVFRALKITPRDMIAIIQALKAQGAIKAVVKTQ